MGSFTAGEIEQLCKDHELMERCYSGRAKGAGGEASQPSTEPRRGADVDEVADDEEDIYAQAYPQPEVQ